jgi:GDP-L-fucose synthase
MKTLVTGGNGLVGQAVQRVVAKDTYSYHFSGSQECDLRSLDQTWTLFERVKPDRVIHLAARVGGLFANSRDQIGFFEDNLAINMNVIKACHQHKVMHAVFCLSTCIYPAHASLPMKESQLHLGPPHPSNEGYAYSKRVLECQVYWYCQKFGYKWTCVIPTNVYGPNDNFKLEEAHVIPALIRKCCEAVERGEQFIVCGSGNARRQFIYSDDLAAIICQLLLSRDSGNFNCCGNPSEEYSISQIAHKIADECGYTQTIVFDSSSDHGIDRKTACNEKLQKTLGSLIHFRSIEAGIRETVAWYKENKSSGLIRL